MQRLNELRHLPRAPTAAVGSFAPAAPPTRPASAAVGTATTAIPSRSSPAAGATDAAGDLSSKAAAPQDATEKPCEDSRRAAGFVSIALELDQLQITEHTADRFSSLLGRAAAQLQQLIPAPSSPPSNQSRPATAASVADSKARSSAVIGGGVVAGTPRNTDGLTKGNQPSMSVCESRDVNSSSMCNNTHDGVQQQTFIPLLPIRYHLEASGPDGERERRVTPTHSSAYLARLCELSEVESLSLRLTVQHTQFSELM